MNEPLDLEHMKLRDYMATACVQGLLAANSKLSVWEISRAAYQVADTMLTVREEYVHD